ncbi:Ift88 [Symbiodinium microadriaticum]|nr:Ift88 [Symbiodinium microadriaticum]
MDISVALLQETKHAEIRKGQTSLQTKSGKSPDAVRRNSEATINKFLGMERPSFCGSVAFVVAAWFQEYPEARVATSSLISTKLSKHPDVATALDIDLGDELQRHAAHDAAISQKLAEFMQERAEQSANSLEEELERDGDILSCWQLLGSGVGLTSQGQQKSTDGYRPEERGAVLLAAEKLIPALVEDNTVLEGNLRDYQLALRSAVKELYRVRGEVAECHSLLQEASSYKLLLRQEHQAQQQLLEEQLRLDERHDQLLSLLQAASSAEDDERGDSLLVALARENSFLRARLFPGESDTLPSPRRALSSSRASRSSEDPRPSSTASSPQGSPLDFNFSPLNIPQPMDIPPMPPMPPPSPPSQHRDVRSECGASLGASLAGCSAFVRAIQAGTSMMSFTETSQLLQKELMNDYSYRVDGIPPGMNDSQYDFSQVQSHPPPSAYMQRTAAAGGRASAMPQSRANGFGRNTETARPMTSNRAAGYTAAGKAGGGKVFDPLNQGDKGTAKPLEKKTELSPEEKLREMEKEIHRLVEESAITRERGNLREALEKGKEAGKKERQLCRLREQQNLLDQLNVDLTYAVCLNLAIQHQANDNDNEALTIYTQIVKNKQYPFSGRFRVNMGNIYFKQEKWTAAIKMYRMALDQIPNNVQAIRFKIMRNIGHAFFKMHQFPDAIDSYENLLMHGAQHLDFMTGFNLILCYYALGDKDKMKSGFLKLLAAASFLDRAEIRKLPPASRASPSSRFGSKLRTCRLVERGEVLAKPGHLGVR